MKNLKDQLLKAKLVSKKQVRKVEHQERERQKKLGRKGVQEEKEHLRKEREEKERLRKAEQQRQSQIRKQEEEALMARQRIAGLVAGANLLESGAGPRRFHFVASDGSIPYLELSDDLVARLEKGTAAIVELSEGEEPRIFVVPPDVAKQLNLIDTDAVRFWNREHKE